MKRIYTASVLFFALHNFSATAQTQTNNTVQDINSLTQEEEFKIWNKSENAAGLLLEKPTQSSRLEAGYRQYQGNFRRPQSGTDGNQLFLNTNGNIYLKNLYLQGYFSYEKEQVNDAEYNAGLIDPLRNMPYLVADTNASDWQKQHYNLGFKVTTMPLANRWSLGLAVDYEASSGAKQRDIRAENSFYSLSIKPAIVYSLDQNNTIGANFLYQNNKEESNNKNVNTYVDQGYYFLFGLGNAINYVGSGITMNYLSDAVGGGLQYQHQGKIGVFASVNYRIQAEDANSGFTNSRPIGSILQKKWTFNGSLVHEGEHYKQLLSGHYDNSKSNGIEYITEFVSGLESDGYYVRYKSVRSKYNVQNAQIKYDLIKKRDQSYQWKASAHVTYGQIDNRYLVPASRLYAENLSYGIDVNKAILLNTNNQSQINFGIEVDVKNNLGGSYQYKGDDIESLTVTDLEQRNFEYLTAEVTTLTIPIVYSQRLKQSKSTIFAKGSGYLQSTSSYNFNNRKGFSVSIGATF